MKHIVTAAVATTAIAAGITAAIGAGAAAARTYDEHGIKLTKSQTAAVAANGWGSAAAGLPSIPNLIYNPTFGQIVQSNANQAAAHGTCIEIGVGLNPAGNSDYVKLFHNPAACAP